jgi:alkylation response protein AidB-like acyl-CoA dehydrogenase
VTAIAMTEPHAGSDFGAISTTAIRDGDHFVVNGSKTFITNGINADLVITAVKTEPAAGRKGMSVLAIERGLEGLSVGATSTRSVCTQDTAELSFTDMRTGEQRDRHRRRRVRPLMRNLPQERLGLAMAPWPAPVPRSTSRLRTKERTAFGQPIAAFQNTSSAWPRWRPRSRSARSSSTVASSR